MISWGGVSLHVWLKIHPRPWFLHHESASPRGGERPVPQSTAACSALGTEDGVQKTFIESLINSSTQQIFVEHLSAPGTSVNQTNANSYPSEVHMLVKRERPTISMRNKKVMCSQVINAMKNREMRKGGWQSLGEGLKF